MGFTGFLIAITIVCFLLILAIMVQNPKGGGLSSSFGGSTASTWSITTGDGLGGKLPREFEP